MPDTYSLEFNDIAYDIYIKINAKRKGYKRILTNISGRFVSGQLTLIMGGLGSGKTSLLKLLMCSAKTGAIVSGAVTLKGKEEMAKTWMEHMAFVEKEDCIFPNQTVYEYIYFAVRARRISDPKEKILADICNVTAKMGIDINAPCKMAHEMSGFEKKKMSIAMALCMNAEILILDEPTNGLDAGTAFEVTNILKEYAVKNNKIVVMTANQPGQCLFNLCDHLYFLFNQTVFFDGPISTIDNFLRFHGIPAVKDLSTPELMSQLFSRNPIYQEIRECEYRKTIDAIIKSKRKRRNLVTEKMSFHPSLESGFNFEFNSKHVGMIIKREFTSAFRDKSAFLMALGIKLIISGCLFYLGCTVLENRYIIKDSPIAYALKKAVSPFATFAEKIMCIHNESGKEMLLKCAESLLKIYSLPTVLFPNFSFLHRSKTSMLRELEARTYSIFSLYLACFVGEVLYMIVYAVPCLLAINIMGYSKEIPRLMLSFATSMLIIKPCFFVLSSWKFLKAHEMQYSVYVHLLVHNVYNADICVGIVLGFHVDGI